MAKAPTKAALRAEIQVILKDANLEETASKKVRLQLEQNLKCDLSNRKKEVDELVMEYVNSQASGEEEENDGEDDDYAGNGKEDEDAEDDDDDDEDYSEEEKPKARKSAGGKRGRPAKRGPAKKKKRTSSDDDSGDDDDQGSDDDYNPRGGARGGKKKRNNSDSDSDGDWKKSKPAKKAAGGGDGVKRARGYTRPYTLSADLAALCGAESLPRHEVVKKIWAIIKERNLYDPKNRQFAICDDQLKKVIGVKRFRTFGMLKYLKPHFKD